MKKLTLTLLTAMLLLIMAPLQAAERLNPIVEASALTNEAKSAEVKVIMARVDEIKAMDKSSLSSSERKALRQEMRMMKQKANDLGSTVYISGGLILLIVLLIILL